MTLREQCEAFLSEMLGDEPIMMGEVEALETFARQKQAVGLREAAKHADEEAENNVGTVTAVYMAMADWCEQQAREWEGMR